VERLHPAGENEVPVEHVAIETPQAGDLPGEDLDSRVVEASARRALEEGCGEARGGAPLIDAPDRLFGV
jgi:hypothetical protein